MVKQLLNKIISIATLVFCTILFVLLGLLKLIPLKIYLIVLLVFLLLNLANIFVSFRVNLNQTSSVIQIILSMILIGISAISSFYLFKTLLFMDSIGTDGYKVKNYSVIVLKERNFNELEELNGKNLALLKKDENESKAIGYLESKIQFNLFEYNDIMTVRDSLYNSNSEAIVIENSYKGLIEELDPSFSDKTKVIHTFSIKYEAEDISKNVDVTSDAFAIYISGIDTYGEINSVSRSDVNIVAIVNPTTYQVLLISIPRDYYVQLHGTNGYKDKLTHAGMYGVEMSVQTIEDLLDIDINYYVKVNFTSLIDIVDALDGVQVYSEYAFTSKDGYYFYKGYNNVNGEQALEFARTRKAFVDGDRQRGKNQQAVIEAVIRKLASNAIIAKYDALLNAVSGKFQTNLETNEITSLAKLQLEKMPKWTVKSISLNGSDSSNYTYTYSSGKLYVMEPNLESINDAKTTINKILNNETVNSSYGEVSNVKNPGLVETKPEASTPETNTDNDFTLNIKDVTLKIGETIALEGKNAATSISWMSSNPSIATVSENGVVTAISEGAATITASISGTTANCIVRVTNPLEVVLPNDTVVDESIDDNNNDSESAGSEETNVGEN